MYSQAFRQRFWSKVSLCEHGEVCEDCCWPWNGAKTGNPGHRYGSIWAPESLRATGKRYISAHHAAWEMAHGPIPDGLWVLHNCPTGDNTLCVNYNAHLWLGTHADNMRDMAHKDRGASQRGASHYATHLTDDDVLTICALRGKLSQRNIGALFNLEASTIGQIQRGERWRHVARFLPPARRQAEQVATLAQEHVYAIRALKGQCTEKVIAQCFGISRSQVGRIWRRECWGWLPDHPGIENSVDRCSMT